MYLLDTHAIIWYVSGSNELSSTEFDAEAIKKLPDIHKDPFDRLLIAQATENNLTIVTTDSKIPQYNVKTIW